VELNFIETKLQLVDIFTKPLLKDKLNFIKYKLFIEIIVLVGKMFRTMSCEGEKKKRGLNYVGFF